jgi:HlyD family secretion protein
MKYITNLPFLQKIFKNKLYLTLFILALLGIGYYAYANYFATTATKTTYNLTKVEKGNIITLISGSGQIVADSQVDAKSQSSGQITRVNVKAGDKIVKGQILAVLDQKSALISLQQAQNNVSSAKASYDKFMSGLTDNEKAGYQISVDQAGTNIENAKQNLIDKLKLIVIDLKNDVVATNDLFVNYNSSLPSWSGDGILTSNEFTTTQLVQTRGDLNTQIQNLESQVNSLNTDNVESNLQNFTNALNKSYDYFNNLQNLMVNNTLPDNNNSSKIESYKTLASNAKTKAKNNLASINTNLQNIANAKQNLEQSKLTFNTKTENPTNNDVEIQKASLNNSYISLQSARNNLENTIVRAPFSGTVASVNAKVGEMGASSIATIIANEKLAKIQVSESDAVKIKVGQKANLTFDSIPDEKFTGKVDSIDVIGTISQGVVTYNVYISLDQKNDSIKPNMSVNSEIILAETNNVLKIDSNAIKTFENKSFVQKVNENITSKNLQNLELIKAPERVNVEIGASDDTFTEIKSGLNEDDLIVLKVNNGAKSSTQTSSLFNMFRPGGSTKTTTSGSGSSVRTSGSNSNRSFGGGMGPGF